MIWYEFEETYQLELYKGLYIYIYFAVYLKD